MYAIVTIAGQQFKVEKNKKIFVHRLPGDVGTLQEFDQVNLIDDEGRVKLGNPYIDNALVTAKILTHLKGDKVLVFKKKNRKGYRKLNGHRQYLTEIIIDDILENAAAKKTAPVSRKEKKEPAGAEPAVKAATVAEETVVKAEPQKAKKPAVEKAVKAEPKAGKTEPKAVDSKPKAEKAKPKAVKGSSKAAAKAKPDAGKVKKTEPKPKSAKKQPEGKKK